MRKRLNLVVLIAEMACITMLHSYKTNHSDKVVASFTHRLGDINKLHMLRGPYIISSIK